jgi:hypothetical protein
MIRQAQAHRHNRRTRITIQAHRHTHTQRANADTGMPQYECTDREARVVQPYGYNDTYRGTNAARCRRIHTHKHKHKPRGTNIRTHIHTHTPHAREYMHHEISTHTGTPKYRCTDREARVVKTHGYNRRCTRRGVHTHTHTRTCIHA